MPVYVSRDGSYRVILNVYAPEIELKLLDGAAVVEIARGQTAEAGVRDFRWDGSHLHCLRIPIGPALTAPTAPTALARTARRTRHWI
jgi:hypothetical protein